MKTHIEILQEFDRNRSEFLNSGKTWNVEAVGDCFRPCAEELLCNGYFLINDLYILDFGSIELYYHEEDANGLKDSKMYHTNENLPKNYRNRIDKYSPDQLTLFYKTIFENSGYPYFTIGSFNLHQSGVDVTFENKEKRYRASFLIRSYRMMRKEDLGNNSIPYDPCSSHIYDDMNNVGLLSFGNGSTFKWVEYPKGGKVIQCPRRNLDEKPWQFLIEGLEEIK